jgi:hypothetical protein
MEGYKQDTFKEASASAEESAMAAQSEADIHRTSVDNTITALSSMSSDFKALETVQKEFLTKTGVTAESLAELGQTLD